MSVDFASLEARDFAETSDEREAREWRDAAEEAGWGGKWEEFREYVDQLEKENDETDTIQP